MPCGSACEAPAPRLPPELLERVARAVFASGHPTRLRTLAALFAVPEMRGAVGRFVDGLVRHNPHSFIDAWTSEVARAREGGREEVVGFWQTTKIFGVIPRTTAGACVASACVVSAMKVLHGAALVTLEATLHSIINATSDLVAAEVVVLAAKNLFSKMFGCYHHATLALASLDGVIVLKRHKVLTFLEKISDPKHRMVLLNALIGGCTAIPCCEAHSASGEVNRVLELSMVGVPASATLAARWAYNVVFLVAPLEYQSRSDEEFDAVLQYMDQFPNTWRPLICSQLLALAMRLTPYIDFAPQQVRALWARVPRQSLPFTVLFSDVVDMCHRDHRLLPQWALHWFKLVSTHDDYVLDTTGTAILRIYEDTDSDVVESLLQYCENLGDMSPVCSAVMNDPAGVFRLNTLVHDGRVLSGRVAAFVAGTRKVCNIQRGRERLLRVWQPLADYLHTLPCWHPCFRDLPDNLRGTSAVYRVVAAKRREAAGPEPAGPGHGVAAASSDSEEETDSEEE